MEKVEAGKEIFVPAVGLSGVTVVGLDGHVAGRGIVDGANSLAPMGFSTPSPGIMQQS
jgi:hypothetical protein